MRAKRLTTVMLTCAAIAAVSALAAAGGGMRGGGPGYGPGGMRGAGPAGRRGAAGRGMGPRAARAWDKSKEITIRGTVVEGVAQGRGGGLSSGLTIRTESGESRRLRLGPLWYVESLGLKPAPNDQIEVIGMPWEIRGQGEIIARDVIWRGATYNLRTADGRPLWAGAASARYLRFSQLWNPERKETISGEIESVESMYPAEREMGAGVAIRLREQHGKVIPVALGPAWYVEEQLPDLKAGQRVTVTGSLVQWEPKEVLIAAEVERDGRKVRLRDESGRPEWAGGWQNWGGWGPGSRYGGMYNTGTVETVTGTVEGLERTAPRPGMGQGVIVAVKTRDGRQVQAHLGPLWFLGGSELQPKVGDEVTVTGSVVSRARKPAMMVREITWNNRRVELRRENGTPVWMPIRAPAR